MLDLRDLEWALFETADTLAEVSTCLTLTTLVNHYSCFILIAKLRKDFNVVLFIVDASVFVVGDLDRRVKDLSTDHTSFVIFGNRWKLVLEQLLCRGLTFDGRWIVRLWFRQRLINVESRSLLAHIHVFANEHFCAALYGSDAYCVHIMLRTFVIH